jgi:NADPH:quinone reductase-like Zn-dependent oxidoreductase
MKAVRIHSYGGPDVLVYEEADVPRLADGEVLIRVTAAGVNPLDWKMREFGDLPLPLILGWEFSGAVAALSPDVTGVAVDDLVYGSCDGGAYAEYLAVRAYAMAPQPGSLDPMQAAAVPLGALTAWQALIETAQLAAGQTALIHRAAGGIGCFAVQLARWRGAHVIGTASARNHAFLRELGADEVIDYTTQPFESVARDVDVVFDMVGGDTQLRSLSVLRRGGVLVTLFDLLVSPAQLAARGQRGAEIEVHPGREQLMEISALIDAGHVSPVVETVLPLAEVRRAHELSQAGHVRGKIVLQVAE